MTGSEASGFDQTTPGWLSQNWRSRVGMGQICNKATYIASQLPPTLNGMPKASNASVPFAPSSPINCGVSPELGPFQRGQRASTRSPKSSPDLEEPQRNAKNAKVSEKVLCALCVPLRPSSLLLGGLYSQWPTAWLRLRSGFRHPNWWKWLGCPLSTLQKHNLSVTSG